MQEQIWWNLNAETNFNTFKNWVGDENAETKVYIADYLKPLNYQSIVDL